MPSYQKGAMRIWHDIGPELSLGLFVLLMVGAMTVAFLFSG